MIEDEEDIVTTKEVVRISDGPMSQLTDETLTRSVVLCSCVPVFLVGVRGQTGFYIWDSPVNTSGVGQSPMTNAACASCAACGWSQRPVAGGRVLRGLLARREKRVRCVCMCMCLFLNETKQNSNLIDKARFAFLILPTASLVESALSCL